MTGVAMGVMKAHVVDNETRSRAASGSRLKLTEKTYTSGKKVRATVVLLTNSVRMVTERARKA